MWQHAPWQKRYLPHPLPAGERLRAYAEWCNAVEGNTTFYATPARATVESWARQTGEDFRFLPKLPRTVTHDRRLTGGDAELGAFLRAIEPLGPRTEALWVQLPGSFGPNDLGALAAFLRRLPGGHRRAVEVRHPAFFEDERAATALERVLAPLDTEWVPFDTVVLFERTPTSDAEREAWTKKPRLPRRSRALTARPIVRYLGRDDADLTVQGWAFWTERVAAWLQEGRSPTVFVHTPDNADALDLARRFHADVRARVPALDPLPEPEPTTLF
ncbi:DUF72 domain-containing protein [Actinomadura parmotrematis]|uniref:DUF72 domain-containing protein n=1 Tax=Actinomadura parmotrematis TaxID=2864039 RepID=A0ABS7FLG0_9ACTN|nr:DUF72 domain-containing protein [Actinomadura parmotrematis]MBW8481198.1 DUF72 domain-containing protein [Actinomadura parmotrematis]